MIRFLQLLILGPLFFLKRRWKFSIGLLLVIGILTVFTQIGGIVIWVSLPVLDRLHVRQKLLRRGIKLLFVVFFYGFSLVVIVPHLAAVGGRVPLPCFATSDIPLQPANIGYCVLARNYVRPTVRTVLVRIARNMSAAFPATTTQYLDGNFPFFRGFPLLPHLSHHDGKKLDVAFLYRDATTHQPLHETPSPIGYWAYEQPQHGERQPCRGAASWLRWNFEWFQPMFAFAEVDPERTTILLQEFIAAPEIQKILIEPHLQHRWHLEAANVRFQGCSAARHDDHIHIQIR